MLKPCIYFHLGYLHGRDGTGWRSEEWKGPGVKNDQDSIQAQVPPLDRCYSAGVEVVTPAGKKALNLMPVQRLKWKMCFHG